MQEKVREILGDNDRQKNEEIEIERKWSVDKQTLPANLSSYDKIEIEQGYFKDRDGKTHRLRKYIDKEGELFFQMQTKTRLGTERSHGSREESRFLNEREFSILWALTEGMRIKKTRYYIPYLINLNGEDVRLKIELDFFQTPMTNKIKKKKEIVMAEVEFTSKEQSDWFTSNKWPNWFKEDITDKDGSSSKSIAKRFGKKAKKDKK